MSVCGGGGRGAGGMGVFDFCICMLITYVCWFRCVWTDFVYLT